MKKFTLCGGNGLGVPPVPIPNTEVKPQHADGTWLETARESRSLPHPLSPLAIAGGAFLYLVDGSFGLASLFLLARAGSYE